MPLLAVGPNWHEQFRESGAIEALQAGRPDQFPLEQAQQIINQLLQRRGLQAGSTQCDERLTAELSEWKGQCPGHAACIAACLHVLTYDRARDHIWSIRPDPDDADEFFELKAAAYLQCIWLAQTVSRGLCSEAEVAAAFELLKVVRKQAERFIDIGRLLREMGRGSCEELLPLRFVRKVLQRSAFPSALMARLEALRAERNWAEAYRAVEGLSKVVQVGKAPVQELLREFFPGYVKWALWRPKRRRIKSWSSDAFARHRGRLARVFELEGPDTTGQQMATLRESSPGAFVRLNGPGVSPRDVIERMMIALDYAALVGTDAIDLFLYLCVERDDSYIAEGLEEIDAVFSLGQSSAAGKILDFHVSLHHDTPLYNRVIALAAALPLFQASSRMQNTFATKYQLAARSLSTMRAAQEHFRELLKGQISFEKYAFAVHAMGTALQQSAWLHSRFPPQFAAMLRRIPTEARLRATLDALKLLAESANNQTSSPPSARQAHINFLASCLGGSTHIVVSAAAVASLPDDPLWYAPLAGDRAALRQALRSLATAGVAPPALATQCLAQAAHEHDLFVHEMADLLPAGGGGAPSDQGCVNLAGFLGPRTAAGHAVHACWRALLLHMMRARAPLGLLDRCGRELAPRSWAGWLLNLRRLFGDGFLEAEGGVAGFTAERLAAWEQRKMGLGRSTSSSTTATASSDGISP